jgi:PKD repeat protein
MKNLKNFNSQFAVLLSVMIGLSGFVGMTASAQSSNTHYRDTTLASAIGRPTGAPIGCIDSDILWTSENGTWTNNVFNRSSPQGDVSTRGQITVNEIKYIYGLTQSDALMYTVNDGETWETVYSGGGYPAGHSPADATCLDHNGTLHWFTMDDRYIFEIVDGDLIERLDLSNMNSFCSNMADTIFIARGNNGIRGYSIDDWNQFEDMTGDLEFGASIDWKDNKLLVIDGMNVWSRSTSPGDAWTALVELDPTGQWSYCTWLVDPSANQFDLAVGSATFDKIQVWRQIVAPTPDFSATPLSGTAPLVVQFTDESIGNPTEWLWNFGDGNTSTEENPDHIYTTPGEYTVSLTASNSAGSDTETKIDYIMVVWPQVTADFSATPLSGVAPLEVQFADQSVNANSWSWNFGDGNTSTEENPDHIYTTPGEYTVTLTVTGLGGVQDTEVKENLISVQFPAPVADFSADPTGGTAPVDINFINLSTGEIDTYFWDFGDGNTSPEQNPVHTYNEAGTYTVTLTVEGPGGSSTETKVDYITVVEPAQVVITSFTFDPAAFGTIGGEGNFTQENGESAEILSSLGNQYSVDFLAGTITATAITNFGDDVLTLTVTGANGSDSEELVVMCYADHGPLPDSLNGETAWHLDIVQASENSITFDTIFLQKDSFINLYNFSYQTTPFGPAIQNIQFIDDENTLQLIVSCNFNEGRWFHIKTNESGNEWHSTEKLNIYPSQSALAMLSPNITTMLMPGDIFSTEIYSGQPSTWTYKNITHDITIKTTEVAATGFVEVQDTVGAWTFGPGYQLLRISVDNGTSTISRDIALDGTTGLTPTEKQNVFSLNVYPNPGASRATLTYNLPKSTFVQIRIDAIKGDYTQTILQETQQSGNHSLKLPAIDIPAGVYIISLQTVSSKEQVRWVKY